MARTTTRRPQAPKRDRRCVVIEIDQSEHWRIIDANVRKYWRKTYCRDRNVGMREGSRDSYWAQDIARHHNLLFNEQLNETFFEDDFDDLSYMSDWDYIDEELDRLWMDALTANETYDPSWDADDYLDMLESDSVLDQDVA